MPLRAVGGAGSRARWRLEPALSSSLARRQAVDISITRSLEERRRFARSTRAGGVLTGRTVHILMFSDQTHDARSRIVSGPRARMARPIAATDECMEFMGV